MKFNVHYIKNTAAPLTSW